MNRMTQMEEKTAELISLLQKMQSDDYQQQDIIDQLRVVYFGDADSLSGEKAYRHSYSAISRYLYNEVKKDNESDMEAFTLIDERLIEILDALEQYDKNDPLILPVMKLRDHISLEAVRISQQRDIYVQLRATKDITQQVQLLEQDVHRVEGSLRSINAQEIAVLSIFAGMAFIFTGGLSGVSSILPAVLEVDTRQAFLLISVVILLGTVIIDAVWLLILATHRFTGDADRVPKGFWFFTGIMVMLSLLFFGVYVFMAMWGAG